MPYLIFNHFPLKVSWYDTLYQYNLCGGSIFTSNVIITAAHCCEAFEMVPFSRFEMVAGDLILSSNSGLEQRRGIKSYLMHPSYKKATIEHDMCLIELKTPFDLSVPHVGKVAISTNDPNAGTNCKVSGWGATYVRINQI